jgi:hypothetical protein
MEKFSGKEKEEKREVRRERGIPPSWKYSGAP